LDVAVPAGAIGKLLGYIPFSDALAKFVNFIL
jgi:hypothetical protein